MISDKNPFEWQDRNDERMDAMQTCIDDQQRVINMLVESVGLLMRIQNIKDDRARARQKDTPPHKPVAA